MVRISVSEQIADEDGWVFRVELIEDKDKTEHTVSLPRAYYEKLAKGNKLSPEKLIQKSFEFLLSKEPKESILTSFTLSDINKYFPDFEKVL
jgi:hypothetical protein